MAGNGTTVIKWESERSMNCIHSSCCTACCRLCCMLITHDCTDDVCTCMLHSCVCAWLLLLCCTAGRCDLHRFSMGRLHGLSSCLLRWGCNSTTAIPPVATGMTGLTNVVWLVCAVLCGQLRPTVCVCRKSANDVVNRPLSATAAAIICADRAIMRASTPHLQSTR